MGFRSIYDNASSNIASSDGTLMGKGPNTVGSTGSMTNATIPTNDTQSMEVPEGTVPAVDNRWGTF